MSLIVCLAWVDDSKVVLPGACRLGRFAPSRRVSFTNPFTSLGAAAALKAVGSGGAVDRRGQRHPQPRQMSRYSEKPRPGHHLSTA